MLRPSSQGGTAARRFVLLDRDGTIIEEKNYLSDPDQVVLLPGAVEGMRRFQEMGLGLAVITNQSGVGRGYFDLERLEEIHRRMLTLLDAHGVSIQGIYFCPHLPTDGCRCRKPETGNLEQATRDLDFDAGSSFVVGDRAGDVELGRRAGATTFLVTTGYGAEACATVTS